MRRAVAQITDSSTFAERLVFVMARTGMKQCVLAAALGVKESMIAHYTSGRRVPKLTNLRKICRAIPASADFLLGLRND